MASNETHAEIVREMFEYPKSWGEYNHLDWKALADRIEAAHKREIAAKDDERLTIVAMYENVIAAKDAEIAELRECLKEAIDYNCSLCKCKGKACEFDGFCAEQRWRKALKGINNATK